jgi:hypothetical protein
MIALEEHFVTPSMLCRTGNNENSAAASPIEYDQKRLLDLDALRIGAMDKYGVDLSVLGVATAHAGKKRKATS